MVDQQLDRVLKIGAVRWDLVRRIANSGGKPAALSEREFLLLQALMRAEGDVCTRVQLLQDVWGYSFDPRQ